MSRAKRWGIAALAATLAAGAIPALHKSDAPSLRETKDVTVLADSGKVQRLYADWKAQHELAGGDHNVQIGLGYSKGISAEVTAARGGALVDLLEGRVEVRVSGIEDDRISDVWLVENVPAPDHSAMPDPGDRKMFLGTLESDGYVSSLTAELGSDALVDFEVDVVVVALGGSDPSEGGVLFGSPKTFQRLYTKERKQLLAAYAATPILQKAPGSVFSPASLLTAQPAYASHLEGLLVDPDVLVDSLVATGADLFINEQFAGNGRTCATCHPASNNFTIDEVFIDNLKNSDPLFVAEQIPALADLEVPALMRGNALILENLDGFNNPGLMRGVPHTLGLSNSLRPPFNIFDQTPLPFDNSTPPASGFPFGFPAERTGWGGDGAPNAGSLRDFATGAVTQHFPLTLNRVPGVDFRLPNDPELDAMEAFQLALGRPDEFDLEGTTFRDEVVAQGQTVFNTLDTNNGTEQAGKCALCHRNAGANINSDAFLALFGLPAGGNANFGTGVNGLANIPADLIDPANNPRDGGFGVLAHIPGNCVPPTGGFGTITQPGGPLPPGLCEEDFNVVSLVEAADTGPFFHNNAVTTIESAVAFYNDDAFNNSAGGQLAAAVDTGGIGIRIDSSSVAAVGSLLRVVNALENLRSARELSVAAKNQSDNYRDELLDQALEELFDAREVLLEANLHPFGIHEIEDAIKENLNAQASIFFPNTFIGISIDEIDDAVDDMIVQ